MSQIVPENVPADVPQWTTDLVLQRMVRAAKLCQRSTGRVGPAQIRTCWPVFADESEAMPDDAFKSSEPPERVTARHITMMEEALVWPSIYLAAWDGPARCLAIHLAAKARRLKLGAVCRSRGIPVATMKWGRAKAVSLIAQGLDRDGIEVRL